MGNKYSDMVVLTEKNTHERIHMKESHVRIHMKAANITNIAIKLVLGCRHGPIGCNLIGNEAEKLLEFGVMFCRPSRALEGVSWRRMGSG